MRYVAFLRAINVGGHVVKMEVLKTAFLDLGFTEVETFIASGNVIFDSRSKDQPGLERKIERALEATLGYEVVTFLRTLPEVTTIARYEPFTKARMAQAVSLNVGLLKGGADDAVKRVIDSFRTEIDDFHLNGAELYWLCRRGQMESKFSNAAFERKTSLRATFRGLKTMERLAVKYPPT
jgi:uncharacterized protein (DUF1697 family)